MTLYCSWYPRGWLTPTWIVFVLAVCSFFSRSVVPKANASEDWRLRCDEYYSVTQTPAVGDCVGTYMIASVSFFASFVQDTVWSKMVFPKPRGLITSDTQVAMQAQRMSQRGWIFWGDDNITCMTTDQPSSGKVSCKKEYCFQDREMPDKVRDQVENPRQHTWTPTPPVLRLMDWKFGEEGYYVNRNGDYTQSNRWYKVLYKEEPVDYRHNSYSTYLELDQFGRYHLHRRGIRIHGYNPEDGAVISATSGLLNPWISYLEDPTSVFYGIYRQTGKYSYVMMDFSNLEIPNRPTLVPDVPSITLEYVSGIVSVGHKPMKLIARKREDGCGDVVGYLYVVRWDQINAHRHLIEDSVKLAYTHQLGHSVCVEIGHDCNWLFMD